MEPSNHCFLSPSIEKTLLSTNNSESADYCMMGGGLYDLLGPGMLLLPEQTLLGTWETWLTISGVRNKQS